LKAKVGLCGFGISLGPFVEPPVQIACEHKAKKIADKLGHKQVRWIEWMAKAWVLDR